jgi:hypothetical protein
VKPVFEELPEVGREGNIQAKPRSSKKVKEVEAEPKEMMKAGVALIKPEAAKKK